MASLLTLSVVNVLQIVALSGVVALIFAGIFRVIIGRESDGTDVMQKIAKQIRAGAMAFLTREYSVIIPFMIVVAVLLYLFLDVRIAADGDHNWGAPFTALSFLVGAFCSGLAGFIGMRAATMANVRTAQAARTSMMKALRIAFMSGATMGLAVVGLGLIGFTMVLLFLLQHVTMTAALQSLTGFSFGASCVALFARVGGGIYTKAADVGADLVGKVEAGIPEDDPRNPAVIADNVGDNVGDVAGMGADLFESYIGAILATMLVCSLHSKTAGSLHPS